MRISDQRKQEIIAAFQRSFKRDNRDEIASIKLAELRQADEMLGDRDLSAGFRLAMRNRIRELEEAEAKNEQRTYESRIRAWNLVTGILIGLVIAGLAKWLFG
ncbi:hypothetical protein [Methylocaldum sp. 14B]|jgi:hypothetical protein|uniref:hypothetical protein n=1 Tax=Methylocaldum sp. 14B TaxID=1912213 RepID=UPI00098B24BC|nr:hypothetical protein [Methylocaldum sp. 14B]